MMLRTTIFVSSLLICLAASPSSLEAQIQEEHQDTYPSECLADWDPFCPLRPPGSGEAFNTGCYVCFYIPQGPGGEPPYYICDNAGGAGRPSRCTNYSWGCTMSGVCQVA